MILELLRISSQEDSTNGVLFLIDNEGNKRFLCYTLEDEHRERKVKGETRIPAGEYGITLRTVGGFHIRYSNRFPDIHKGMLWLRDVPNFEFILIHCGNNDEHTAGCILVGETQNSNIDEPNGMIGRSRAAYKAIYPELAEAAEENNLKIRIIDYA